MANAFPLALYIHWPFCRSKCPYCDFNSHVAASIDHDAWREAYRRELDTYAALLPGRRIASVFFGGGTPSLMQPATVEQVVRAIDRHWSLDAGVEITLEANPSSAEAGRFADFRAAGINRLSLGVQSLRDDALAFLGRGHSAAEARQALALAARFFPRFSFDLIYARRGQTPDDWRTELDEALALGSAHLSLYQLTIEPNTAFATLAGRGVPLTASEAHAAAMFEMTQETLAAAGMPAYEISNHARAGEASRHNLVYWHYDDYIGIGPGAHGRYRRSGTEAAAARLAVVNHRAPEVWLKHVAERGHGVRSENIISAATAQREAVMMGLRLTDGIERCAWREKFDAELDDFLAADKIQRLCNEGYLTKDATHLRATASGRQRLNAVLDYLLN